MIEKKVKLLKIYQGSINRAIWRRADEWNLGMISYQAFSLVLPVSWCLAEIKRKGCNQYGRRLVTLTMMLNR